MTANRIADLRISLREIRTDFLSGQVFLRLGHPVFYPLPVYF